MRRWDDGVKCWSRNLHTNSVRSYRADLQPSSPVLSFYFADSSLLQCHLEMQEKLRPRPRHVVLSIWMQQRPRPRSCRHLISTINNIQENSKAKVRDHTSTTCSRTPDQDLDTEDEINNRRIRSKTYRLDITTRRQKVRTKT